MSKKIDVSLSKIKKWEPLVAGDIVDIIAPSSGGDRKSLLKAIKFVRGLGLRPRYQKGIFGPDLLCASNDQNRFKQLKTAVQSKDSKVVWCLRGGYGSARLLPMLDKLKTPKNPKLLIGYSDITHLHMYFNYKWKWPSLHASMLEEMGSGQTTKQEIKDFKKILFGKTDKVIYKKLKPLNKQARANKMIRSQLTGGNLTILMASFGTPYQVHADGQILMLEDIGERGYRVDRMLVQLKQAGYFNKIRALIFGDFVGGEEKDSVALWKEVQKRFAGSVNFPVLKNIPSGHSTKQRPLPLMTRTNLYLGAKAKIEVSTGIK